MSVYVADASVAVKWYVPEIHSDEALRLLEPGNELHVPDLMQAEVGNILWKKARRGELTPSEARRMAGAILVAPLRVHATSSLLDGALDIALRTDRTVYDALYVALAVALDVGLVTADRRLFQALERSTLRRHVTWVQDLPEAG
jgi:predicted nucleic acid-binding protein